MPELIMGADMSSPLGNYAALPEDVSVVLGYLGGDTPHTWTPAEVTRARAAVGDWWGIWTAPSRGQTLSAAVGERDAAGTIAALGHLGYPSDSPVFYDIEHASYAASPAGARAAWQRWQSQLTLAGWPSAWPYLPAEAGYGWAADWTGQQPTELQPGVIGVQYVGPIHGRGYDLSVFSTAIMKGADMPTAKELWQFAINAPSGAAKDKYGYAHPSYTAAQYLVDTNWRTRDNGQRLARLAAAIDHLAAEPADQVDARAIIAALADALAGDGTAPGGD